MESLNRSNESFEEFEINIERQKVFINGDVADIKRTGPYLDGEESEASSGYESGYMTPKDNNNKNKNKRKPSQRNKLLNATIVANQLERLGNAGSLRHADTDEENGIQQTNFPLDESDSFQFEEGRDEALGISKEASVEVHLSASGTSGALSMEETSLTGYSLEEEKSDNRLISHCDATSVSLPHLCSGVRMCEDYNLNKCGKGKVEGRQEEKETAVKDEEPHSVTPGHKPLKTGKQRLRWNLLFNLLVWLIIPIPLWLPFVDQTIAMYLIPSVQGLFVLMWVVIVTLASKNMITLYRYRNYDFKADYPMYSDICHLVVISCYKEPVALIARSVQSLADQTEAKRISMVVSFEEKTPEVEQKIEELGKMFCNSFERLLFTIHPFGQPNEIPGKCSNANHGLRESVGVIQEELGNLFDPTKFILTTCDADSNFHPKYIEALTSKFLQEENPHAVVFQAPLLYNWGLDGASFVTRVTGLIRTTLMMGALIPFNINTMSIFSFSLKLCMNGNFVHPGYQMDDIICLIRWMGVTRQRLRIPMIPVPVISGPTSGSTIELELSEWARQARRWTIGAGEVFHYYVIKAGRMPFLAAFTWGLCFLTYYGILLCSAGLYGVSASVAMALLIKDTPGYIVYTMYGLAALQQVCFLVIFILDVAGPKLMKVKEHISFIRNFFHWILAPFVLIGYSLVEFYALHEVMVKGKEVCKHGASKKSALQPA